MPEDAGKKQDIYIEPQYPDKRPTRRNLLPLYKQLNKIYFDEFLPKLPVVFNSRLKVVYGRCHAVRRKKLWKPTKIDIQYPIASQRMLRKVLVHEMCHAWAILKHQDRGHSVLFWKKMEDCGYPDGHQFANALQKERDKYDSDRDKYPFQVGQFVSFVNTKKKMMSGEVLSVNKRTVTIQTSIGKYRVSPSLLAIIDGKNG
jgi:hypothetical protein